MQPCYAQPAARAKALSSPYQTAANVSARPASNSPRAKLDKQVSFDMPLELRNQVSRIALATERSAGAVSLMDARTKWNRIGLLSGTAREEAQPLLDPLYYIRKAVGPFAELTETETANLASGIKRSSPKSHRS